MTTRRAFLTSLLGVLAAPLAGAQPAGKVYRIGLLSPFPPSPAALEALGNALRELGWVEGRNLVIERRYLEGGEYERLPALAAELVRLKVDLIVAFGLTAPYAKRATATIPIVLWGAGDPVALGLVQSLARPGGNVTGTSWTATLEAAGKELELLKEVVPRASRVATLDGPLLADEAPAREAQQKAAQALRLDLFQRHNVRGAEELEAAFAAMTKEGADALRVVDRALLRPQRKQITDLAARHRLPAVYGNRVWVEAGGLIAYGPDARVFPPRVAAYIDKILKGARPGDLPVEQPSKFELVVNLKAAKGLGLTIPPSVLVRADEVIE
jgi:putative ABC transport system substrate-binding protein